MFSDIVYAYYKGTSHREDGNANEHTSFKLFELCGDYSNSHILYNMAELSRNLILEALFEMKNLQSSRNLEFGSYTLVVYG